VDTLIARHCLPTALRYLEVFPALVIQGARQVGKSTLSRILTDHRPARVLNLDDTRLLAAAREDPMTFVGADAGVTVVIDEIQRCPELMLAVKMEIDRDRTPGRFILTGSSDLLRLSGTPDSLAGRAVSLELGGFSQGEMAGRPDDFAALTRRLPRHGTNLASGWSRADYVDAVARGGYPEARRLGDGDRKAWLSGYLDRLVRADAARVSTRLAHSKLRTVLKLLAARQSGELVKSRLAGDAGIPETSIGPYLDALETLYLTTMLPAWTANLTSREIGRRKAFLWDSALAMHLGRLTRGQLLDITQGARLGPLVEGLAVTELLRQRTWSAQDYEVYHYRDRAGHEVDAVLEFEDGKVFLLEVKATQTFRPEHFAGMKYLASRLGERFIGGAVLGLFPEGLRYADQLWALPLSLLWEN